MAHINIILDDETGIVSINSKGFNYLELLGVLNIAKNQILTGEGEHIEFEEEEATHKQIKTKGNA